MAYIVGTPIYGVGGGTSVTLAIPGYVQENDVVLVDWVVGSNGTATTGATGWATAPWTAFSHNGMGHDQWGRIQPSSPDTSVSFTLSSANNVYCLRVIRGAYTSGTWAQVWDNYTTNSSTSNATTQATSTFATSNADCLLLYSIGLNRNFSFLSRGGLVFDGTACDSTNAGGFWGHAYQESAGTIPAYTFEQGYSSGDQMGHAIGAIRDDGNGYCGGYCTPGEPMSDVLYGFKRSSLDTVTGDGTTTNVTSTGDSSITTVGGVSTVDATVGQLADALFLGHLSGFGQNNTAGSIGIKGHNLASAEDLSGAILSQYIGAIRDPDVVGTPGRGIGLVDTAGDAMFYEFAGGDAVPRPASLPHPCLIDVDGGFEVDESGTFDSTIVDQICPWFSIPSGASGDQQYTGPLRVLKTGGFVGGSATVPLTFLDMVSASRAVEGQHVLNQQGLTRKQYALFAKVRIGSGGTYTTYFKDDGAAAEWPFAASVTEGRVNAQVGSDTLGLELYPGASDTIDLRPTPLNGGNLHRFEVVSGSSTSGSTYIGTVKNFTPVLRPLNSDAFSEAVFDSCDEITHNSCDIGGATVRNSTGTQAITLNGSTQAALQSLLDNLADCTFSGNAVAIRIEFTGTGDVALSADNITASGNTTDVHYNSTNSSALTITLANGSNLSTSATSGSATGVTFSNDKTFTVDVNVSGAEITILQTGTQTEAFHTETATTSEDYTFTAPLGYNVDIQVFKPGYKPYWEENRDLGSVDSSLSVTLEAEPAYG